MIRMVCTRHPSNASSHLRHMRACGGSVAIYVDAGHGGWIGFEENAKKFAAVVDEMGITPYIISPCPCPSFLLPRISAHAPPSYYLVSPPMPLLRTHAHALHPSYYLIPCAPPPLPPRRMTTRARLLWQLHSWLRHQRRQLPAPRPRVHLLCRSLPHDRHHRRRRLARRGRTLVPRGHRRKWCVHERHQAILLHLRPMRTAQPWQRRQHRAIIRPDPPATFRQQLRLEASVYHRHRPQRRRVRAHHV